MPISATFQPVVESLRACLGDHGRRQINTNQPVAHRPDCRACKPGAAAEIKHRAEPQPLTARIASLLDPIEQERGRPIGEAFERGIEARRILVEQGADIGRWHRIWHVDAKPDEAQAGAMAILRVGALRRPECRDGARPFTELLAQIAERKPCRGKARCHLDRLDQQVGGAQPVAAGRQIHRKPIAPVGEEIAG